MGDRDRVKIYTRTGDTGRTSLFGGRRVLKQHLRLEAYGTLDELNSFLGWFRARTAHEDLGARVEEIQSRLFDLGAHLATPASARKARAVLPPLEPAWIEGLEAGIDRLEGEVPPLASFILPGGNEEAALLHVCRSVCRRAERSVVRIHERGALDPLVVTYLNRLSDLLFVMARAAAHRSGGRDVPWVPRRPE